MNLKPQLVTNQENGKLCIQISDGPWTATKELPDDLDQNDENALRTYLEDMVPRMVQAMAEAKREAQLKMKRKAKQCSNGTTKRLRDSTADTPLTLLSTSSSSK
jgi:hypothetical protein